MDQALNQEPTFLLLTIKRRMRHTGTCQSRLSDKTGGMMDGGSTLSQPQHCQTNGVHFYSLLFAKTALIISIKSSLNILLQKEDKDDHENGNGVSTDYR